MLTHLFFYLLMMYTIKNFKQEWGLFHSVDEVIETIKRRKEICRNVAGTYPKGGRY